MNPLIIEPSQDLAVTATFVRRPFTDDFETGGFNPALNYDFNPTGSATAWQVQDEDAAMGQYAARSGTVAHGQRSGLGLTAVLDAGVGSFAWKVSSEASWDALEFYLNGLRQQRWSGQAGWDTYEFSVPEGTNTLEWRYVKDVTINAGLDGAFIDNILLPLASAEESGALLKLTYITEAAQLELRGLPDRLYILQASPNLSDWQNISTNLAVDGVVRIADPTIGQESQRFYRAIKP
jgi:hypothetical protein